MIAKDPEMEAVLKMSSRKKSLSVSIRAARPSIMQETPDAALRKQKTFNAKSYSDLQKV